MRVNWFVGILMGIAVCAGTNFADAQSGRLSVSPNEVKLESRRAYRQFVVMEKDGGAEHDVTREVTCRVSNPNVAQVKNGLVTAKGNGRADILLTSRGATVRVPITVANFSRPDPVQFKFETLAILTKQGCATGSCHGSPHGKGGFSLSLYGYDPNIDKISLTRDGFNRRINVMEPTESLMLKKPLLEIPHIGGKHLHKTDAAYRILHDWIYQGANVRLPDTSCSRIVLTPNTSRVLHAPYLKQQISVLASFTDGATRDVSATATYDTSNASVATVDADGLVTGHNRGQAAISVRYLDKLQSVYFTVVEDVPGFQWRATPENNVVDTLVDAKLKQLQYLPSGLCDDATFLRRVSLDLTGLLPTPEKTRSFLKDKTPDKRSRLIDELLDSEEYAHFWAMKKADLMRVAPSKLREGRAELFADWIVDAFRKDKPYDAFARELLTAEGDTESVPAANYFLAIPTMQERTEMTAQLFMGTRIECAKCHNHPFEAWTMRDYYSISAVFARTQADDKSGMVKLASAGEAMHPTTGEAMKPWGMAAKEAAPPNVDRREAFAKWLTSPGNSYFARVEVNRIWADLLGRGIVEPVDDFRSSNPPSNVPLLDTLAQAFEKSGYRRKTIIRLICNSRTYQRVTATNKYNATDENLFSHARVRLLTAEQLKDAMGLTTQTLEPTASFAVRIADLRKKLEIRAAALEPSYPAWLAEQAKTGDAPKSGRRRFTPPSRLSQILAIDAAQRTEEQRHFLHEAFLDTDSEAHGLKREMVRLENRFDYATQRPYPEDSQFTVTFGQPRRETACTCERQHSPTLLQALELLNGGTAYKMAESGAKRCAALDNDKLIENLYLSALCRFPTDKERGAARQYLAKAANRETAVTDFIWTVINTQEFLFQH